MFWCVEILLKTGIKSIKKFTILAVPAAKSLHFTRSQIEKHSPLQWIFFWRQSSFLSQWQWFPLEMHQPESVPPSFCRQKKIHWSTTIR
jgi:hypothetical protein